VTTGKHFIKMNGREVFRFATRVMAQATEETISAAGLKLEDIQLFIPHQANRRIIEAALRGLNVSMDRCVVNIDRYGNTSTASIPIATCEAVRDGRLKAGDKLVMVGFGAGLTWGAALAIWSGAPQPGVRPALSLPLRLRLYARLRSLIRRILRRVDAMIWGRHNPYL